MTVRPLLEGVLPEPRARDREDRLALGLGLGLFALVLAFKLLAYERLAYTDDLFLHAQLATSWLDGRPFEEAHYGNHLSVHTYLVVPVLGLLVRPLGPAGLLLALAVAAFAQVVLAAAVLRDQGVPGRLAALLGLSLSTTPLAVHVLHDPIYGFHPELLLPPLATGVLGAVLAGRWGRALVFALALAAVKEEAPLLLLALALAGLAETRLARGTDERRRAATRAGLLVLGVAVVALPVLLLVQRLATTPQSVDGLSRLRLAELKAAGVGSTGGLAWFVVTHPQSWLSSRAALFYPVALGLGSLGLAALRPHLLLLGFPLTVTAWLMDDSLLWPPRVAPVLAFGVALALLGLGSLAREGTPRLRRLAAAVALLAWLSGAKVLPSAREVYLFRPGSTYTEEARSYDAAERREAAALFQRYRDESRRGEKVLAAPYLFRFARTDDLVWPSLAGSTPVWVLGDTLAREPPRIERAAYDELGRAGRFFLLRRRP